MTDHRIRCGRKVRVLALFSHFSDFSLSFRLEVYLPQMIRNQLHLLPWSLLSLLNVPKLNSSQVTRFFASFQTFWSEKRGRKKSKEGKDQIFTAGKQVAS